MFKRVENKFSMCVCVRARVCVYAYARPCVRAFVHVSVHDLFDHSAIFWTLEM